ncbi:6651_t:CDS:1 [Dentiscutata erythropus]|uniref:6651_t:CDS:1 n=1 Tax=Dentiscutata erythropus TaxID=1348616 RepID=A0A9N9HKL5_9GLOM|nr:6651_t:CDS:1 [Dentiscutata erythropus]
MGTLQESNSGELFLPNFYLKESINIQENVEYKKHELGEEPYEVRPEPEEFVDLTMNKNSDNESLDSNSLKESFGEFLDVWVEISAEEVEEVSDMDDTNKDDYRMPSKVEDIVHLAIDPAAKWDLESLFTELQLP